MKRPLFLITCALLFSQSIFALPCSPEYDDDYHQNFSAPMCRGVTKFFISGLTQQLKQPVRDRVTVQNVSPANAIAYVAVTPFSPLIMDGQINTFTVPMVQGQCLDLISTYSSYGSPQAFTLNLVAGQNNADSADFDYEVGSGC